MASNLEEYQRLFRDSHIETEETLWGIHVLIYIVLNAFWIMVNMIFVPSRYRWILLYPVVGWGIMVFVHWWFYVRNAASLCMRKEEQVRSKVAVRTIKPE